jgi:hypothetical protein
MDNFFINLNNYLKILSIFEIVALIPTIILIFFREKYAQDFLRLKDDRLNRIVKWRTQKLKIYRIILWLVPIDLILLSMAFYFFIPGINIVFLVIIMFLLELYLMIEFLFTKWLLRYLADHKTLPE